MAVTPPALGSGDQVAIIHNGDTNNQDQNFEKGLKKLNDIFDLSPIQFPILSESLSRQNRIEKMNEILKNEDITGIFITNNGTGYIQLVNNLDEELIKNNPTWLFGTDDSTYLQLYFNHLGVSSVYGGDIDDQVSELSDGKLIQIYKNLLYGSNVSAASFGDMIDQTRTNGKNRKQINKEPIQGSTWGGSLKGISGFLSVNPNFNTDKVSGDILVLDVISEQFESESNLNRAMNALGERGLLEKFSAVIIGGHGEAIPWINYYGGKEDNIPQIDIIAKNMSEYNPSATIHTYIPFGRRYTPSIPIPIGTNITINK